MNLIDKRKFKNTFFSIFAMLMAIFLLVGFEFLISPKSKDIDSLGNGKIKVNTLVINEIMTSNKGAYADSLGNSYDWIELYNGTEEDIDLSGYGLSDEDSGAIKWIFPSVMIESKGYLIISLAGKTSEGLVANFSLNKAGGETVTLKGKSGKVIDSVKTVSLDKNTVMARNENGKWIETNDFTPGYPNNDEGRKEYLASLVSSNDDLEIRDRKSTRLNSSH